MPSSAGKQQDAANNLTSSTANVTVAIGVGSPAGGTLSGTATVAAVSGTATVAAVSGTATFSGLSIDKAGTGYKLDASSAGVTGASSSAFNITAGAPSSVALAGAVTDLTSGDSRDYTATVKDAAGNTVTGFSGDVTFAKTTGAGTVSGLGTQAASAGVATKTLTGVLVGSITIKASIGTGPSLIDSNTLTFTVVHGAPSSVALAGAVTDLTSGDSRDYTATVKDAAGNTVTGFSGVATRPSSAVAGTVSGLGTQAASAGVATKTLTGDLVGSITIKASIGTGPSLIDSNTLTFTVVHGAPTHLAVSSQPNASYSADDAISVGVSVQDA